MEDDVIWREREWKGSRMKYVGFEVFTAVDLVKADVSEERVASFFRVEEIT
jgi:hypothetical protein